VHDIIRAVYHVVSSLTLQDHVSIISNRFENWAVCETDSDHAADMLIFDELQRRVLSQTSEICLRHQNPAKSPVVWVWACLQGSHLQSLVVNYRSKKIRVNIFF